MNFSVERLDPVVLDGPDELLDRDLMSPFVWPRPGGAGMEVLVRAVPPDPSDGRESGRLWYGRSAEDGLRFRMDPAPALVPGDGPDSRGCEDPTVVPVEDGLVVYYTGVDGDGAGRLCYATGPDARSLTKRGVALSSSKSERNTKEATLLRADGRWRLLHEYSRDEHSLIGLAIGAGPAGPWEEDGDPLGPRPGHWDSWHLSPGPLLRDPERPVLFYNGADRDADWGIGWALLTPDLTRAVERCDQPLIAPPNDADRGRAINFAASLMTRGDTIWLYLSRNDRQLWRATVRRT